MKPIPVVIGYDPSESLAFHVLQHAITERASVPVQFIPLNLATLRKAGVYTRDVDARASTEFSLTRFLAPYLVGFEGWVLFMDCDMLMLNDIADLWALRDDTYQVMCCQHDYVPKARPKMLNATQYGYPRKNWSSLMLLNAPECMMLTPRMVDTLEPAYLHRMPWASEIGALPLEWNWLVGEYDERPASELYNLHWTLGGPWWRPYADAPYADLWFKARDRMFNATGGTYATPVDMGSEAP